MSEIIHYLFIEGRDRDMMFVSMNPLCRLFHMVAIIKYFLSLGTNNMHYVLLATVQLHQR